MDYIPKIGDRVLAHSKGNSNDDLTSVYTDWDWFLGTVIKVNSTLFRFARGDRVCALICPHNVLN